MPDAPLDLDAIRHEPASRTSWETKIVCECGERCANWMRFYHHRGDAYLAEVERLRADLSLNVGLVGKLSNAYADALAESIPRSSLVQVGWECSGQFRPRRHGEGIVCSCQPVYVIQEDTDAN